MIPTETRETIRRLYDYRCGYCGVHEHEAGSELEIDHFQPRAANGGDEPENLVYCCPACNRIKSDFRPSNKSAENPRRLLHPGRDNLSAHLSEDTDGRLIALSETGRYHISRLRLNRPQLLALRLRRRMNESIRQKLAAVSAEREQLRMEVAELSKELEEALALLDRLRSE